MSFQIISARFAPYGQKSWLTYGHLEIAANEPIGLGYNGHFSLAASQVAPFAGVTVESFPEWWTSVSDQVRLSVVHRCVTAHLSK